jgi:hypothetical protein
MRLSALFVLLVLLSPHAVGQHRKVDPHAPTNESQQRADNQNPQPQVIIQSQSNQHSASQQSASSDRKQHRLPLSPEWVTAISTVLIFFATTIYAIVSYCILGRMGRQAHEMKRQRTYMRLQWRAMQAQVVQMEKQLAEMAKQTTAMGQQATAMWEQIKMTVAKEMPRLTVDIEGFDLHSTPPPFSVNIRITHYGPTEAYNIYGEGALVVSDSDEFPQDAELYGISLPQVMRPQDDPIEAEVWRVPGLTEDEIKRIDDQAAILHVVGTITFFTFTNAELTWPFWYVWKPMWESTVEGIPNMSHWEVRMHPGARKTGIEEPPQS